MTADDAILDDLSTRIVAGDNTFPLGDKGRLTVTDELENRIDKLIEGRKETLRRETERRAAEDRKRRIEEDQRQRASDLATAVESFMQRSAIYLSQRLQDVLVAIDVEFLQDPPSDSVAVIRVRRLHAGNDTGRHMTLAFRIDGRIAITVTGQSTRFLRDTSDAAALPRQMQELLVTFLEQTGP